MALGFASDKAEQARDLSATLRLYREEILTRWAILCQENEKARTLTHEQLLDHLPQLLDRLAAAVDASSAGRDTSMPLRESREHALHRLDAGFDLPEITNEYALLRQVLFSILSERAPHLVIGGFDVVGSAIDASLSESVDYYVRVRHRTLEALDQVAQVVTGPGDASTTLHRILSVTMQTVPSVDAVTILLRHGDVLKVKEALGVMAERDPSFSLKVGEGFAGTIAATRQPLFLSSADTSPLVRSDFIKQRNIKAMYGVPMIRGVEVVGVAHMASLTANEFAEEDKLLFRSVAERATGVIVQDDLMSRERASRLFLETVINNIQEGVLVADQNGTVVLASEGAARIFGTSRDELLGPATRFNERFHPRSPDEQEKIPALLEALQGRPVPAHDRIVTDAQGRDHFLVVSATPVQHGGVGGAVAVFIDITERRNLEKQLRLAVAFRERLMGIVSHDLRTPLAGIALAAQSVLRRKRAPEWAVTAAQRVNRSVERMGRMVSDLLDFTRIQAHSGMPIEREKIDVCAVVRETVAELEAAHPGRIELRGCTEAIGMWDGDRLGQVVTNLVNNALEHGSDDKPVQVEIADGGDAVTLTVSNRGETISHERLPGLFDPFRRESGDARGSGLGLGLHIVYEVARAHGGQVSVVSRHGVTTFTVTLPRA